MAKNKKKELASMEENFPQWYTDVISKTEMVDYAPVKGFMVVRPYGYALWENIKNATDRRFKAAGVENVYFPLLIPESLLQKEADHIEGFAPEVAWVTQGGDKELSERLLIRPTSETIFSQMYSKWLHSYRQLPLIYNQWCTVVRWEKTTRPFLRTSEFLWQEGHSLHETLEEANTHALNMLEVYRQVIEDDMAIPLIKGIKSPKETFSGAEQTYTVEALMHDGQALQSGTTHSIGQGFAEAFDITYLDRDNQQVYPYQTSFGMSSRVIGALVMVHGDENGLVVPPKIAPIQIVILPVAQHKEGVLDKAYEIKDTLDKDFRVVIDDSDNSPGWKFNQWEMKGVPIRLEIGPRDIAENKVVLARRDSGEKISVSIDNLAETVEELLDSIQKGLYEKAKQRIQSKTNTAETMDEFKEKLAQNPGFVKAMWCGEQECEDKINEETGASLRCIPFDDEQEVIGEGKCVYCSKPATKMAYFARAY